MKGISKVFILDNIKVVRSRLQLLLSTEKLKVIEASNSIEFFNVFLQNKCNGSLIIMDIELIAEDGFQVIRKIRNKNKDIPIIILTANTNRGILNKVIFEGATDYILKPFNDSRIMDKVNEILNSYNDSQDINQKIYKFILNNKEELAIKILSRHSFYHPEPKVEYMDYIYKEILNFISYNLTCLSEAISFNNLRLYKDYIINEKSLLQVSDIPTF